MEKIYMEDGRRNKKRYIDGSVVLSFVVAIVAVFSLAMYGIASNQTTSISYAASPTGESLNFYHDGTADFVLAKGTDSEGNAQFPVPLYFSNAERTNSIFCVEHTAVVVADDTNPPLYNRGAVVNDFGLLYLLNNSYANDVEIISNVRPEVEMWATQVAIWLYLYRQDPNNSSNTITAEELRGIKSATDFYFEGGQELGVEGVYTKIDNLVQKAIAASGSRKLDVSQANNNAVSKTTDGKYYQSSKISVVGNPAGTLQSYTISLSGIDGAFAVDPEGRLIEDAVGPETEFYVMVPVDKITDKVQTLKVEVVGKFSSLAGNYYTTAQTSGGSPLQKVVSVTGNVINVSRGTEIEFVGAPDTGMNAAQTIYFIGLIVLLCGVGIVYANAKPVESK